MRWLALVAAGLASLALCGCFDGTVRDSPEAAGGGHQGKGGRSHQHRQSGHERAGGEGGGEGEATVSFAAVGDTGMGITPELPPEPSTYLDPIAGELKGDVVFGNLEGTLTDVSEDVKCGGAKPDTCYAFRTPPGYAKYYANAGFTVMNLANNHSYDFGERGQEETIEALRGAGIEPIGLPAEAAVVTAGGRRIAFLGFAPYALHEPAHRPRIRAGADPRCRRQRRPRRRRDPRRRRGLGRDPHPRRRGDLPRRGPRQRGRVRPHGGAGGRRPGARLRSARAARDRGLPRSPRRLQPRQLLRVPQLQHRGGAGRDRRPPRDPGRRRPFPRRPPRLGADGRSRPAGPRPRRRRRRPGRPAVRRRLRLERGRGRRRRPLSS